MGEKANGHMVSHISGNLRLFFSLYSLTNRLFFSMSKREKGLLNGTEPLWIRDLAQDTFSARVDSFTGFLPLLSPLAQKEIWLFSLMY